MDFHRHCVRLRVRFLDELEQLIVWREVLLDHACLQARQIVRDGRELGEDLVKLRGGEVGGIHADQCTAPRRGASVQLAGCSQAAMLMLMRVPLPQKGKEFILFIAGVFIGVMVNLFSTAATSDNSLWPTGVPLFVLCSIAGWLILFVETEDEQELRLYRELRTKQIRCRLDAIREAEGEILKAWDRGDEKEAWKWSDKRNELL